MRGSIQFIIGKNEGFNSKTTQVMLANLLQLENLTCGNVGHSRCKITSL